MAGWMTILEIQTQCVGELQAVARVRAPISFGSFVLEASQVGIYIYDELF